MYVYKHNEIYILAGLHGFARDSCSMCIPIGAYTEMMMLCAASAALGVCIQSYCPSAVTSESVAATLSKMIRGRGIRHTAASAISSRTSSRICQPDFVEHLSPSSTQTTNLSLKQAIQKAFPNSSSISRNKHLQQIIDDHLKDRIGINTADRTAIRTWIFRADGFISSDDQTTFDGVIPVWRVSLWRASV